MVDRLVQFVITKHDQLGRPNTLIRTGPGVKKLGLTYIVIFRKYPKQAGKEICKHGGYIRKNIKNYCGDIRPPTSQTYFSLSPSLYIYLRLGIYIKQIVYNSPPFEFLPAPIPLNSSVFLLKYSSLRLLRGTQTV